MPTGFESAFASARKKGATSFGYNGKVYSTKTVEEKALSDVMKENPGLSKVIDEKNANVVVADPKRLKKLQEIGGGDRYMETWHPDDPGDENFPHPKPGTVAFEIYKKEMVKDPKLLKEAIRMDALHMMPNDPKWKEMRQEFTNNFKPEEMEWIEKNKYPNEKNPDESLTSYMDRTQTDAYLRGGLNRLPDKAIQSDFLDEYAQNYRGIRKDDNGKPVKYDPYSPKQREIINQMNDYLIKK